MQAVDLQRIQDDLTAAAKRGQVIASRTWEVLDWPVQDFSAVFGFDPGWVAMLLLAGKAITIGWAGARAYARRRGRT